jgi:hypothetical protein
MDISKLPILSAVPKQLQQRPLPETVPSSPVTLKSIASTDKVSIILSPLNFDSLLYARPKSVSQSFFSNPEQKSPLSQNFANQLKEDFVPNRLSGLGSRFTELLSTGSEGYSQDIRHYSYYSSDSNINGVDFSQFEDNKKDEVQSFSLELKTDSGATIKFSLKNFEGHGKNPDTLIAESDEAKLYKQGQGAGFRSTEIEFEVDGDLTKREREQLVEFGRNLEQFATDIFEQDKPNIKALNLASFDTISQATIKADGGTTSAGGISLQYRDNEDERYISVSFQGNKAEITVDKADQFIFAADGKTKALQQYLKILSDGADEAKAGQMQAYMMEEVFSAGFRVSEEEQAEADLKEKQREDKISIELNGTPPKTGEVSNDVFIPLADFEFSFESRKDRPNLEKKPLEYSGFDLDLSLNSRQTIKDNQAGSINEVTSQKQDFNLKGAFYEALPHLQKPDFKYQNYSYTTFEREASKTVTTLVEDGELLSATMEESGKFKSHTSTYNEGELVNEESELNGYSEITDLTGQFFTEDDVNKSHNQLDILEQVMIDPFKDRD